MRTIIAGSRGINSIDDVRTAITASGFNITVVLSGMARGVDRLGVQWAQKNNIPYEEYPADWDQYKKAAGYRRNLQMAENADALIAIWDNVSPGTKHMIRTAISHGLKIHIQKPGSI